MVVEPSLVSLPIAKSTTLEMDSIWASDGETIGGWDLPGHGIQYADCGTLRFRGCLNVHEHQAGLDGRNQAGKAFVNAYKRSCGRKECPVCYESWAGLEAGRVEYRLKFYGGRWKKPVHVSVNPGPELWGIPFEKLRSLAYRNVKRVGIVGGSCIYHPFRQDDSKKWFFSPHFHVVGYGWHKGFAIPGWVIKNHGVRKSVHATVMYQLSHAGVHEKYHAVTWFGALSYNKLKVPQEVEEKPKCPMCGLDLVPLVFVGHDRVPPPEEGDYYDQDPGDWMEKHGRWES